MTFKERVKDDTNKLMTMVSAKPMMEGANLIYGYIMGLNTGLSDEKQDNQDKA